MPLPKLLKPAYLRAENLVQDDILEVIDKPYVQSAEESKFGTRRGYAQVKVERTNEVFTIGFNNTTWDRLVTAFSDNESLWIGKRIKVSLETSMIRGEKKQIIYGAPVTQQSLSPS